MVALILIFLFATPRAWFRDQPKVPHVAEIANRVFWIESALVTPIPESSRLADLSAMLKTSTGKVQTITRLEPVYDSEKELKGYMAFAKP